MLTLRLSPSVQKSTKNPKSTLKKFEQICKILNRFKTILEYFLKYLLYTVFKIQVQNTCKVFRVVF